MANLHTINESIRNFDKEIAELTFTIAEQKLLLEGELAAVENAVAFDSNLKNDAQRKAAKEQMSQTPLIDQYKRSIMTFIKQRSFLEAERDFSKRQYEITRSEVEYDRFS